MESVPVGSNLQAVRFYNCLNFSLFLMCVMVTFICCCDFFIPIRRNVGLYLFIFLFLICCIRLLGPGVHLENSRFSDFPLVMPVVLTIT